MSKTIKLKRGFDINLAGKPQDKIVDLKHPKTYALKPTDFIGISRPKLLIKEGDKVKAGSPMLYDKFTPDIKYCAPVSGEVTEIKRGDKRKLLEIIVTADKEISFVKHKKYSSSDISKLTKEDSYKLMSESGVWPNIIQRPFGLVADPESEPKAIFISAFDTHPLAPNLAFTIQEDATNFQVGLEVLKKFTSGKIHLNISGDDEVAQIFSQAKGVELNKFMGPHPSGNVGTQIHHIDPINKGDVIWTVAPYGVAQIGKLLTEGIYDASKIVALTGSEVKDPAYVKTYTGAQVGDLLDAKINKGSNRIVSGNVLTGEAVENDGYLGFYHNQLTVIPEGDYEEMLGWILPSTNKLSFHKAFGLLGFLNPKKEYVVDTNAHGEERAFVMSGAFEKVMPMDIYPTFLFKAIMAEDFNDMEGLGIFEVIEEDVALCEFIDVSKHPLQEILRSGLNLLKES